MPGAAHPTRHRPIDAIIGRSVRTLRAHRGYSQETLGQRITEETTQATVANYEAGKTQFTVLKVMQFAQALNVPWKRLLEGIPDELPEAWRTEERRRGKKQKPRT